MVIRMEKKITDNRFNNKSIDFEYKRRLYWSKCMMKCVFIMHFIIEINLLFHDCQSFVCRPSRHMLSFVMVSIFLCTIGWFPSHYNCRLATHTLVAEFFFSPWEIV